jgi:hypothetical protein
MPDTRNEIEGLALFPAMGALTATVNDFNAEFPAACVAAHTTLNVPTGTMEPEAGEHEACSSPSMSSMALAS